jgi:hypothetical protein
MQYFAPLLFILSILPTPAVPRNAEFISPGRTLNGADRTITWGPWQQNPTDEISEGDTSAFHKTVNSTLK